MNDMTEQVKKKVEPVPTNEMMDLEDAKRKFFEKHPPLTEEQVEEAKEDSRKAKKKYSRDLQRVEENLIEALNKTYPMVDPETDKCIGWVKQIPYWKLVQSLPDEFQDESLTDEERQRIMMSDEELQDKTYEMMAEAIVVPEKSKEWWRDNVTPRVMVIFEKTMEKMYRQMEQDTSFF